jgi:hypothetical protein
LTVLCSVAAPSVEAKSESNNKNKNNTSNNNNKKKRRPRRKGSNSEKTALQSFGTLTTTKTTRQQTWRIYGIEVHPDDLKWDPSGNINVEEKAVQSSQDVDASPGIKAQTIN